MASISNSLNSLYTNPAPGTPTSGGASSSSSQPVKGATDPLANESTFLTLLVSQLKNQNPTSPMDGTTFVTQLAQFSDLEQNLAMRNDLDSLTTKYAPAPAAQTNQSSGTGTSNTGTPSGTPAVPSH